MTDDEKLARSGRKLALVTVASAVVFMGIEFAGATFGWSSRLIGLLELGICAVFLWVMIQAFKLWRARQSDRDG